MSIPDDIRDLRKRKYMKVNHTPAQSTPSLQDVPPQDASPQNPPLEESLESVLARVAIYEQDEKLALSLIADPEMSMEPSDIRPPKDSMVDCLLPVSMSDSDFGYIADASGHDFRLRRWNTPYSRDHR